MKNAISKTLAASCVIAAVLVAGVTYPALASSINAPVLRAEGQSQKVKDKIKNAMSAGPLAIARDATVVDWPTEADKPLTVLRQGTNEWTCFTDYPMSPGNDPQCFDKVWMEAFTALSTGQPFTATAPGLAYMLQGGSDPSLSDPFAMAPADGKSWIKTPAHVMLIIPGKLDMTKFSTDYKSGKPYVMFAGTPFEHFMMPVDPNAK